MSRDPDANPLYNKDGNDFTDALINFWQGPQPKKPTLVREERISKKVPAPPPTNAEVLMQATMAVVLGAMYGPVAAALFVVVAGLPKTTFDETLIRVYMNEQTRGFNENQLKRVGMAEAYTPALQQQMEKGVPVIQHAFKKEYDGDKVDASLHLKKSATSDHYFLNRFDLALQKEGQADAIKQTFFVSGRKPAAGEDGTPQKAIPENKYTLKEGYNLLAERPVFKDLVSKQGKDFQAWVQLNPGKVLENGNHELKYVFKQDFNLEKTLAKYPIKELENETYKKSLIESLQRGNLQKVTFTNAEGKEEKLFVSPDVLNRSLKVYDGNKQPLTNDQLVTKLYISKEMAAELKDWIGKNLGETKQGEQVGQKQNVTEAGEKLNGKKVKQDKEGQGQAVKEPKVQKPRKARIGR